MTRQARCSERRRHVGAAVDLMGRIAFLACGPPWLPVASNPSPTWLGVGGRTLSIPKPRYRHPKLQTENLSRLYPDCSALSRAHVKCCICYFVLPVAGRCSTPHALQCWFRPAGRVSGTRRKERPTASPPAFCIYSTAPVPGDRGLKTRPIPFRIWLSRGLVLAERIRDTGPA